MSSFLAELPGTALLIALGDGVVASVLFGMAKCDATGWGVITTSWMLAVAFVVYAVSTVRRGRTTSAVSIAFALPGKLACAWLPSCMAVQSTGGGLALQLERILNAGSSRP